MEALIRRPFQGVINIVRFNRHMYVAAAGMVAMLIAAESVLSSPFRELCLLMAAGIGASTVVSLLVSYYIYDYSDLYAFHWMQQVDDSRHTSIINIHAGFDETSGILSHKFPTATLHVFDFYDPRTHTEVSIERARRAYPPFPNTRKIQTRHLPVQDHANDCIFNVFALHEVRNRRERVQFLKAQAKALKDTGHIVVVEHLRNLPNFLAYNIGFFHFLPGREWRDNFQQAGLRVQNAFTITPFITVFILQNAHGNTP